MRKLHLISFFMFGLLLTACAASQPDVSLETTEFDFGDVINGVIMEKDLMIRNIGTADLIVDTVTTTCGCTTAYLDLMTIPEGGIATLHIAFDSGAHGEELTGEVMRQVILISNDPKEPEATVQFVANILPPE